MIYAVNSKTLEHVRVPYSLDGDETWSYIEADRDGWIPWEGGECPLPDDCPYEVITYSEGVRECEWPQAENWEARGSFGITAYRPALNAKPEAPAWGGEGEKPPVGTRCLKGYAEVLILAHANVGSPAGEAVVYQSIDEPGDIDWAVCNVFSPIRSERDEFIAWATETIGLTHDEHRLGYLYDAGCRKQEPGNV